MKKQFLILFAFISVLALSQVPQRFNKVIVTGDITSPKFIKTGSNADSVLLGNGSARAISTIKTDTVSLSNRINAKATGNGTANGTNTGDETLTSIKTKLGAATAVSDGYLKYQDFNTFNGKQNALTIGNLTSSTNGVSVTNGSGAVIGTGTAINITTASASSGGLLSTTDWNNFNNKQPSGSYEPAFSKNSGFNLPLGTTTGTVLEGRTFGTAANSAVGDFQPNITGLTTNYIPKWNGSSMVNSLISDDGGSVSITKSSGFPILKLIENGASEYSVQYIQNVNSSAATVYFGTGGNSVGNTGFSGKAVFGTPDNAPISFMTGDIQRVQINNTGELHVYSTTPSTTPTNGALVVNGGIGADHVRANNFYGNGSTLTGVQLPITLTTNGTGGAATFSGNVLNVPNYDVSGVVNQTQTTVNGSTSGNMVCSMPFREGSYKKVIIRVGALNGTATYTYPVAFSFNPVALSNSGSGVSGLSISTTSITVTGTTSTAILILEGY